MPRPPRTGVVGAWKVLTCLRGLSFGWRDEGDRDWGLRGGLFDNRCGCSSGFHQPGVLGTGVSERGLALVVAATSESHWHTCTCR